MVEIVSFPINSMVIFNSYVAVYQRVYVVNVVKSSWSCYWFKVGSLDFLMVSQNKILAPLFESLRSLGGHMGSDVTKKGVGDILPAYKLGYDIEHRTDRTQFQKVAPFSNFSSISPTEMELCHESNGPKVYPGETIKAQSERMEPIRKQV